MSPVILAVQAIDPTQCGTHNQMSLACQSMHVAFHEQIPAMPCMKPHGSTQMYREALRSLHPLSHDASHLYRPVSRTR